MIFTLRPYQVEAVATNVIVRTNGRHFTVTVREG